MLVGRFCVIVDMRLPKIITYYDCMEEPQLVPFAVERIESPNVILFFFFFIQLTRDAAHNAYIDIKDAYSEHSHFHIVSQRIYRQLHRKRINNNKRNGQINDFDLKLHTLHFVD